MDRERERDREHRERDRESRHRYYGYVNDEQDHNIEAANLVNVRTLTKTDSSQAPISFKDQHSSINTLRVPPGITRGGPATADSASHGAGDAVH